MEDKRPVGTPHSVRAGDSATDSWQGAGRRPSRRRSRGSARPSTGGRGLEKDVEKATAEDLSPISPTDTFSEKQLEKQPFAQGAKSAEGVTALPIHKELGTSPHLRPATTHGTEIPYNFGPRSSPQASIPPGRERGRLIRPQSRNKRSANNSALPSRKSSKRSKSDHVREEEIRAMSAPVVMPKRNEGYSGAVLRRDSKKMRGGLNRHLERPVSNISLPMEDSIHSSMSGNSEPRGYLVGTLNALAPRPTLRASINLQYTLNQPSWNASRPETRNTKRPPPSRELVKDGRTIDDLADDLDASDLRAVMERDARRREKKKQLQEERLRHKLERRAEKQRAKEQRREQKAAAAAAAAAAVTAEGVGTVPAVANADRTGEGVTTTVPIGLGIEAEPSSAQRDKPSPQEMTDATSLPNTGTYLSYVPADPSPSNPFASPEDIEPASPIAEPQPEPTPLETPFEEPIIETAQTVRYSQASMSPPTSPTTNHVREPSNLSQMISLTQDIASEAVESAEVVGSAEVLEPVESLGMPQPPYAQENRRDSDVSGGSGRRGSGGSGGRRPSAWASWFRRGTATGTKKGILDRGRSTPSEASFSNTSRESMSRHAPPAHLQQKAGGVRSGTPVRTQSKFREDLPEMPISPPDSRVQSPELSASAAIAARRGYKALGAIQTGSGVPMPSSTADEPLSNTQTDSPVSPSGPASNLMSRSLASVDSEGSWLSGKPSKRTGQSQRAPGRGSVGSSHMMKQNMDFSASYEELGMPDEEYFKKLTPQPDVSRPFAGVGSAPVPSSLATAMALRKGMETAGNTRENSIELRRTIEEGTIVRNGVGRQPTVVHRDPSVRSAQGLVNEHHADADSAASSLSDDASDVEVEDDENDDGADDDDDDDDFYDASQEQITDETSLDQEPPWVQRAKSVELGKNHIRHLSAGSARLLDIPVRRGSVDKRSSIGSASPAETSTPRTPLTPSIPQHSSDS